MGGIITDQRGQQGDRRRVFSRPDAIKQGGWLRQAVVGLLAGLIVAAFAAFLQAAQNQRDSERQAYDIRLQTESQIRTGLAVIEEREENHYKELLRLLMEMREDLRDGRRTSR